MARASADSPPTLSAACDIFVFITFVMFAQITQVMQDRGGITDVNSIQDRLRYARQRLGMTQRELGRKAGVGQSAISNLESGLRSVPREIVAIAKALAVDPEWLLSGKGNSPLEAPTRQAAEIPPTQMTRQQYSDAASRETFLQSLVAMVIEMPPNRWASIRAQLDGLSDRRFDQDSVMADLRALIGAVEWDGISDRRSGVERRSPDGPKTNAAAAAA